jgi:hypothetical protein
MEKPHRIPSTAPEGREVFERAFLTGQPIDRAHRAALDRRVGATPRARLQFVIDLCFRRDLGPLYDQEIEALADDFLYIVTTSQPDGMKALRGRLTRKAFDAALQEIRSGLQAIGTDAGWSIFPPEGERVFRDSVTGAIRTAVTVTRPLALMQQAIVELVRLIGPAYQLCPVDHVPFIKHRKQVFCSPTCAQQAREIRRPPRPPRPRRKKR